MNMGMHTHSISRRDEAPPNKRDFQRVDGFLGRNGLHAVQSNGHIETCLHTLPMNVQYEIVYSLRRLGFVVSPNDDPQTTPKYGELSLKRIGNAPAREDVDDGQEA